jgi:ABC-type transporter Mla subunit MlaD
MRRYHQEVLTKMKNFEYAQDTMHQEVETQLDIMKSHKFQENQLKKIVLDVITPRDKIERENVKKYNKVFKNLEGKINTLLQNQRALKTETDSNASSIINLESKVLSTFHDQLEEMKKFQSSPQKSPFKENRYEDRLRDLEERITEKANQTISFFDSLREDTEHNKTNLDNLATLYSSLTENHK